MGALAGGVSDTGPLDPPIIPGDYGYKRSKASDNGDVLCAHPPLAAYLRNSWEIPRKTSGNGSEMLEKKRLETLNIGEIETLGPDVVGG